VIVQDLILIMLNRPMGHRDRKMSENQSLNDLLNRLASLDSKLEELLSSQTVSQREGLPQVPPEPEAGGSQELGPDPWKDADSPEARHAAALPPSSGRVGPAISPIEADTILQKVQKINSDAELMERVIKLEKQNRKITILGSMFMTLSVLILAVFTVSMVQANLFNRGVLLHARHKVDSSVSSPEKKMSQVSAPPSPQPVAKVNVPPAAGSVAPVRAPEPGKSAASNSQPKTAKAPAPVTYVGSITSNKYHYPDCKWAAKIKPYKLRVFQSVKEAREQGYIPCPTCRPPRSAKEELSTR
jgi:hypothetical protein